MPEDPVVPINKILDGAGMNGGNFLTGKKSMTLIVSEARIKLVNDLRAYMLERDAVAYQAGVEEGRRAK